MNNSSKVGAGNLQISLCYLETERKSSSLQYLGRALWVSSAMGTVPIHSFWSCSCPGQASCAVDTLNLWEVLPCPGLFSHCAASSLSICREPPIPFTGMLVMVRAAAMEVAGLRAADAEDAVLFPTSPPFSFLLLLCSVPGSFPCPLGFPCCP